MPGPFALRPQAAGLLALSMLAFTATAHAAGFALIEQSTSGLGSAYAGSAASAEDASTVFFNPAGLMFLKNDQIVVAGHIIKPSAKFSGSATDPLGGAVGGGTGGDAGGASLVPNFYYSRRLPNDFVFGLGINAPFGLKTEYDAAWAGRYQAIESDLQTININPSLAYKAGTDLSVAVGVNFQYIEATLSQAVNPAVSCVGVLQELNPLLDAPTALTGCAGFGITPATDDVFAEVEGDDWSYGFNFGLIYELHEATRIGFAYRSKVQQELEGNAKFDNVPAFFTANDLLVNSRVTANVALPESASLSLYHEIDDRWLLLADATWTRWNRFQELRVDYASSQPDSVTVENWRNSMRYSIGARYRLDSSWQLRAGAALDEEPIPDAEHRTPRIPGSDRTWLAFGANYRYSSNLSFDAGYARLFLDDASIRHTDANGFDLSGKYDNAVDILSAQASWSF